MGIKLLLVSGLCAALGAGMLKVHVDRVTEDAWGGPPAQVVVMTEDLSAGAYLYERHLAVGERPERYVESRHIPRSRMDAVVGLRTGLPVKAGEPLLWTDIAGMQSAPRQLSSLVPEGMRAVAIHVRKGDLSGLIRPGDRVDVLRAGGGRVGASTVLENMLVLAIGTDTGGPGGRRGYAGQITLNATPAQAEVLTAAEFSGGLRITVRNPSDAVLTGGGP